MPPNKTGFLTLLNKHELSRIISALTREYTPGVRCNSRKTKRLPPRYEMSPDSPTLRGDQFRVAHQTRKEP